MTTALPLDFGLLATVTVTYNPDLAILHTQISQLPKDAVRIIVDNASAVDVVGRLRVLAAKYDAHLIENSDNLGLAAASNQGILLSRQSGVSYVLLLDQDTEPGATGVARLRDAYLRLLAAGGKPGCIGPRLVDVTTGLGHGFHVIHGWCWVRQYPKTDVIKAVECTNLNGSGTLIPAAVLERLGGLDEGLFIDHVDTEWAFRVLSAGFGLYGAPDVIFRQRMGERSFRFWWLGWRVWPYRNPQRHYYIFRNAIRLMRRAYVPTVWKGWAIMKLVLTFAVHLLFDHARLAQAKAMLRGIKDGLRMTTVVTLRREVSSSASTTSGRKS